MVRSKKENYFGKSAIRKILIRTTLTLRGEAFEHYKKDILGLFKKDKDNENANMEKVENTAEYSYLEDWFIEEDRLVEQYINKYLNEVLLKNKKIIDLKGSFQKGFLSEDNSIITIIYEEVFKNGRK